MNKKLKQEQERERQKEIRKQFRKISKKCQLKFDNTFKKFKVWTNYLRRKID